ncbi:MAG: ribonuclease H-like domain-containing protein [Polyangiaceae bacterium]
MLDDLRAKMDAILSREPVARRVPALDQPDLPFQSEETPHGTLHRRVLRLPPSHRVGRASRSRSADPGLLALLALDPALAACPPSGALYLDTETTGLAGGTGTVAFLVGLAFWDPDPQGDGRAELVVEQLLVRNLGEEAPMLAHVAARVRAASMLVTFNGKSFDMPLLRTRFVLARMEAPPEPPHLDLLHVARRIHKARGVQCRLIGPRTRSSGSCGKTTSLRGDVSACYLHFLRTGETAALLGGRAQPLGRRPGVAARTLRRAARGSAPAGDDLGAARVLVAGA